MSTRGHAGAPWHCSTVDLYRCGAGRPDWLPRFSRECTLVFAACSDELNMRSTASSMLLG